VDYRITIEAIQDPDQYKIITVVRADSMDEALMLYWLSRHYPDKFWGVKSMIFHTKREGEKDEND
jgi:hypothetical protein